jgi:hypothetical protein
MRRPRRTDRYQPPTPNMAAASLPSWLDEETGRLDALEDPNMVELEPINIQGDPNRTPVIELEPIDIVGDPDAPARRVGDYSPAPAGTRAPSEPKPMNRDWLDIVSSVTGEATEDERTGLGGYQIPEWAARAIADDDGNMPTGALEAIGNILNGGSSGDAGQDTLAALGRLASMGSPGLAIGQGVASNLARDTRVNPEDRTVLAAPALMGLADAGSFGLADDIAGYLQDDPELRDQMRSGVEWARREAPGSTRTGELVAQGAQMAIPSAPLRAGATPLRMGAAAALEGAAFGGLEGAGRSDAETLGGRLADAAPYAAMGAGFGGPMGYVGGRLARSAETPVSADDTRRVEQHLDDAAWDWLSQAGANQSSAKQKMLASGARESEMTSQARWMVDTLRDRGVIPPMGGESMSRSLGERALGRFRPPDQDAMLRDIARLGDEGHAGILSVGERMGGGAVDAAPLVSRLRAAASDTSTPFTRPQGRQLREWADDVETTSLPSLDEDGWALDAGITFPELQRWKTKVGNASNYDRTMGSAQGEAFRAVTDSMNEAVATRAPELVPEYRTARENSLIGLRFDDMGAGESRRAGRNRTTSPTDYFAAGTAAGTLGPLLSAAADAGGGASALASVGAGAAAMGINRWHRATEHGRRAMRAERQAQRILNRPEVAARWAPILNEAAQRGPRAIAAAMYLIQQRDPQAREAMQAEDVQPEAQAEPMETPPPAIEVTDNMTLDDLIDDEAPIEITEETTLEDLL